MNDYVLVCNGPKVALTTRDNIHLDYSFWQRFVRDPNPFFRNADVMLSDLESSLQWFDVTQLSKTYQHGNLLIRRGGNAFVFDVVTNKVPLMVAMCELKNGQLYPIPIYSMHKCDVILWENLVHYWRDFFKKAFYDAYGFDPHDAYGFDPREWPHYIRSLYTFAQSES